MGAKSNKFSMSFGSGLVQNCKITGDIVCGDNKSDGALITTNTDTELVFDVQCDRNGQSSVAADWNNALDNSPIHMNSYQLIGHNGSVPDKLNFYIPISMDIDGQSYDLLLGQGNYGFNHNWWLGSLSMYTVVQGKVGVNLLGISFLMHKQSGHKLLPSVNTDTFNSTSSMTLTNLYN